MTVPCIAFTRTAVKPSEFVTDLDGRGATNVAARGVTPRKFRHGNGFAERTLDRVAAGHPYSDHVGRRAGTVPAGPPLE